MFSREVEEVGREDRRRRAERTGEGAWHGGSQEGARVGLAQQVPKAFLGFSPVWSSTLVRAGLVAQ